MRWVATLAICLVVSASARADWGARRDPFDAGVASRYKAILERDPYDDRALRELVGMYRRHRTVAKLEAEYHAQLAAGERWAALVVLARVGTGDAVALWRRAVAVKPDDARAWIAIGDAANGDAAIARDAYARAAKVAASPREQRLALTKLIAAARDATTIDHAYAALLVMAPNDGHLWLDRGDALLAAKRFAAAKNSFAAAEPLLRRDPERRLTAMTSQGLALDGLGRGDEAIAQYERTLEQVPRGHFLGQELVLRIIETERKRGRLDAASERLEKRWPERTRGHFEWAVLGDLYLEQRGAERARAAYARAVAKAPTEVATQRKLIALLDQLRPAEALAQHEAAARVAPGEADLHLALARRYHPTQPAKAVATLEALARRRHASVSVRSSVAALYEEWNQPARALRQYEAIARLEPGDPDHAIVLGDAYWQANDQDKARTAWRRLDEIGTPEALFRHGQVLALHDEWAAAAEAYTKALVHDAANVDALYGRARANEALSRLPAAIDDAKRAVALTGNASHDDGMRNRHLLVRVLGKQYRAGDQHALRATVARWRFAFDHGDREAGYLLAAHHEALRSPHHELLVELYRRVPTDDSLGLRVVRSYTRRHEFGRAREELVVIARRTPARAKELAAMREDIDNEQLRIEREIRLEEEGEGSSSATPDIVGRRRRLGIRFGLGADVASTSAAVLGVGVYRIHRLARGTAWTWRFDWTKRDDEMREHAAFALGGGVMTRIFDARRFEVAAVAGPRVELRYGNGVPESWNRAGVGGELTLELLPRALPATLGLRLHQSLTDPARSSTLVVELGIELR